MHRNFESWHYWLLLALLVGGGWFVHWRETADEIAAPRRALKDLPAKLGDWQKFGADGEFGADVLSVLRPDDYLLRDYYKPANNASANIYVGYYRTQRTGATYHSPRNCLPGAGWTMSEADPVSIALPNNDSFVANKYIVENKGEKQIMLYWYQGRGRFTANEYKDKMLTIWDSIRLQRSDGALVRVVAPLNQNAAQSEKNAVEIAGELAAALPDFVP